MIQQNISPNASTGIAPALAAPSRGLNDDFLLDDTGETPEPTIHVPAFKPSAPGQIPEESDTVDLIAAQEEYEKFQMEVSAANEELGVTLRDLQLLRDTIKSTGGMNTTVAIECNDLMPGFINEDVRPMGYFTVKPSKTMLSEALEAIAESEDKANKGFVAKMKELFERFMKFIERVKERIKKMFSTKSGAEKIHDFEEAKKDVNSGVTAVDALFKEKIQELEQYLKVEIFGEIIERGDSSEEARAIGAVTAHQNHWGNFDYFKPCIDVAKRLGGKSRESISEESKSLIQDLKEQTDLIKSLNSSETISIVAVQRYFKLATAVPEYMKKIAESVDALSDPLYEFMKRSTGRSQDPDESAEIFKNVISVFNAAFALNSAATDVLVSARTFDNLVYACFEDKRAEITKAASDEAFKLDGVTSKEIGPAYKAFIDAIYSKDHTGAKR